MMRHWIASALLCVWLLPALPTAAQEEDVDDALSQLPPQERTIHRRDLLQLERVARRLMQTIPENERPQVQFSLVPQESSINAGATFGQIMVTGGMMQFVRSDDELGMILGHELAHITQGHVTRGAFSNMALGIGAAIANVLVPNSGQLAGTVGQLFLNRYNQSQENEADQVGLRYAFEAGFDPDAGPRVMERMSREVPQTASGGFFSSHPGSVERAANLRRLAVELKGREPAQRRARDESARQSGLQRDEEACQKAKTYFYRAKETTDRDEKVFLYQRGLRVCPQSPRAHFELANAYASRRETREAVDELREVLRYDPDYPGTRERLQELQRQIARADSGGSVQKKRTQRP
ncbi:MAG: M48 family metalloprotease [Deltaproteobacteria bacterium]|nr:M48 family metalloprotease [Deltaproteobacteria bacterium]